MKEYHYLVNCVELTGNTEAVESLREMTQWSDKTRQVTWETFLRHVPIEEVRELFPQYSYRRETYNPETEELTIGFHLKDDWAISFWRGEFMGRRVYYIVHSGIEYIFAKYGHPLR